MRGSAARSAVVRAGRAGSGGEGGLREESEGLAPPQGRRGLVGWCAGGGAHAHTAPTLLPRLLHLVMSAGTRGPFLLRS